MKRWKKVVAILLAIICVMAVGSGIYIMDYYHADMEVYSYIEEPAEGVTVDVSRKGQIAFVPDEVKAGIIFYPGGKVQMESYAPLFEKLAEKGFLCVMLRMRGNLAVLDGNAADGVKAQWPDVEKWYLAGHSLGGVMAASYGEKHADEYQGLILLAAYTTVNLNESGLLVLSIYGSEDGVLNREQYEENYPNIEKIVEEAIIGGGNHAGFGDYGDQKGDGMATISREEQWMETVDIITTWIRGE